MVRYLVGHVRRRLPTLRVTPHVTLQERRSGRGGGRRGLGSAIARPLGTGHRPLPDGLPHTRPNPCYPPSPRNIAPGEDAMANREQRGNKEKKKTKADKNKKDKHQPLGGHTAPGQSQDHPGFNVLAKKT